MTTPIIARLDLPADHPVFAGHFPAYPIVPGALILDEVVRVASEHLRTADWTVRSAKFVHPAAPSQSLQIALLPAHSGTLSFRVTTGDTLVASGELQGH